MKTRILLCLPVCMLAFGLMESCKKENLPEGLDWSILRNPSRLPLMNGKLALTYEVSVNNSSLDEYSFESIRIKDGSSTLLELEGSKLDTIISVYSSGRKLIGAGETAFLYLWVEVNPELPIPGSLTQTFQFNRISDGKHYTSEMEVSVDQASPIILSFPLSARRYATTGAPAYNSYHRRTIHFIDGVYWTSEKYSVDLIGLDDGNRYRQGRQDANIDYYGYGDMVSSATAGEVVSVIDTLPENIPPKVPEIDPLALNRAAGNQVVVKMAAGIFVFYGHLLNSSIHLKPGDRIEAGDPIGKLGNSGNSDAPQLHLQVMDGPDPLKSNGIPWVFDRFILHGNITGYDHTNGMIRVNYLTVQEKISGKNFGGQAVVGIE